MDENKDVAANEPQEEAAEAQADQVQPSDAVADTQEQDSAVEAEVEAQDAPEAPEPAEAEPQEAQASELEAADEAAEGEEAVEAAEGSQAEAAQDKPAEAVDAAQEAVAPAAAEPSEQADEEQTASIGHLLAVGILAIIMGVLLCLPTALGLIGGEEAKDTASGAVAAVVNGKPITEEEVSAYVADFRKHQGLESDEDWGKWMVDTGYTAEKLRTDTIEYFADKALIQQAITEQGIEVADADIDSYIDTIKQQVGGEEAFEEALAMEGIDMEAYRADILFSLQQQELAKKVAGDTAEVDDAQVLELVKMYYPDQVKEDATTLEGVDEDTVNMVRDMISSSVLQQSFGAWLEDYRSKANIVTNEMPESLPYAIDLKPYKEAAAQAGEQSGVEMVDEAEIEEADESDPDAGSDEAEQVEVVEVEEDMKAANE